MRCFALFAVLLAAASLCAQQKNRREVPGVVAATPPVIDGVIGSTEWPIAAKGSGFFDTDTSLPYEKSAEFWVVYDQEAIYFAARLEDDPKTLINEEFRDNVSLGSEDNIAFYLDTYGNLANFNGFRLNANGATDIDIVGGRASKTEWVGSIIASGRTTATGWEAEAKIPWNILPLPAAGMRDLRMNIYWSDRSNQRSYVWNYIDGDDSVTGYWKGVNVPSITRDRSIKLLPYAYAGIDGDGGLVLNSGLDVKTPLGPSRELVATINPDFRNIENQILSLDFSRFERLAGESRPFFQEGSSFRGNGLFASQRIRQFDMGINSYGALNDRMNYGFLSTFDFGNSNATVAKVETQINDNDEFEAALVNWAKRGENNIGTEMQYSARRGQFQYSADAAFTDDEIEGNGYSYGGGMRYSKGNFNTGISYRERSEFYRPRIGFVRERNMRGLSAYVGREFPFDTGPLIEAEIELDLFDYDRLDGSHYRNGFGLGGSVNLRNGFEIGAFVSRENFEDDRDQVQGIGIEWPSNNPYRNWELEYNWGNLAGEDFRQVELSFRMRPWRRIQVAFSAEFVEHFENERQLIATFNWDRTKYDTLSGRIIERDGQFNWHIAYRHGGGRGAEYFLILGDPNSRTFEPQLILKAVFPFELRF